MHPILAIALIVIGILMVVLGFAGLGLDLGDALDVLND